MTGDVNDVMDVREEPDVERRERAIVRLRKKSEFRAHLLAFLVVNTAVVVVWAMTGADFFWPIFPILGWGVGLIFHARDAYMDEEPTEEQIRRELRHMR